MKEKIIAALKHINNTTPKKAKIWIGVFIGIIIIGLIAKPQQTNKSSKEVINNDTTETKPIAKKENDKVVNSEWDGSVKQAKDYLKENLKDWESYESIQWSKVVKYGKASDVIGLGEITKHCISKTGAGKKFSDDSEMDKGDKVYVLNKSNGYTKVRMFPNDSLYTISQKMTYWAAWVQDNCIKSVEEDTITKYSVHNKYRAKNSFGAYDVYENTFYFDKDGNIIKVEK